jgi:RimJ/RimL family protein N-acetyltransferase
MVGRMTRASASPLLTLRPLQPADCDRLRTWIDSSDALWQWSGPRSFTWPLDDGQLRRDLAARAHSGRPLAAVDESGEMVGHVLLEAEPDHGLGYIGRVAVAPDQRGRGLGIALMRATVGHGFGALGLHRLHLTVYTFNAAALATYRAVGFVVEGVARESTLGSEGRWDGVTMRLLETEYRHPPVYGDAIRIAGPRDAGPIARLLTELGYPHDHEAAAAKLLAWMAEPHGEVLVAEVEGSAAGFAAVHRVPYFERPGAFARVIALSVSSGHRRAGVGRRLMAAAERWATTHGCVTVEVTSRRDRDDAHGFYRALGYADRCAQSGRFIRSLGDSGG